MTVIYFITFVAFVALVLAIDWLHSQQSKAEIQHQIWLKNWRSEQEQSKDNIEALSSTSGIATVAPDSLQDASGWVKKYPFGSYKHPL